MEAKTNIDEDGTFKQEKVNGTKAVSYYVSRHVMQQEELAKLTGYDRNKNTPFQSAKETIKNLNFATIFFQLVPIFKWLPAYSVKKNLAGDLMAGITVAVMHIPQGMAYGLLSGVEPIVGLYMAFFPTLIYFVFGTSRHISTGTFAVVSLMTGKIVQTYSTPQTIDPLLLNSTETAVINGQNLEHFTPIQVATAVTFIAGIYHLIMSILRLGTLASLLSEPLVNGFTTAAAVHVIVSQLKDLLGVKIPRHKGAFKIILSIRDIILQLGNTNLSAVYVSLTVLMFMIFMNEYLKPVASKRCKFPIPAELMAVVGGTLISYWLDLGNNYNVTLVGNIPTGLPMPEVPSFTLVRMVALDSFAVTIVSYSIVVSMALIFARKEAYDIRPNQELMAMGLSNIFGSFFSCIPNACSLSRSLIQHQSGGRTQIASVFSAMLILVVLLWIGPYFEMLPRSVLASIIVVALKGMLMQIKDLKRYSREGILETLVWIITFLSVILIDIDIGLLIGVAVSLIALYIKGWKTYYSMMGTLPDSAIYVDIKTHKTAEEVPQTKIFKYVGSVNFANKADFKKALFDEIGVNTKLIRRASLCAGTHEGTGLKTTRTLILDLSSIPHIDNSACKMFIEIKKEVQFLGITTFIAGPSDCVFDSLRHASDIGEGSFQIFPSVHDAVIYSQGKLEMV